MPPFLDELRTRTLSAMVEIGSARIMLLGYTPEALVLYAELSDLGYRSSVIGVFDPAQPDAQDGARRRWIDASALEVDLIVVCADANKEALLRAYAGLMPLERVLPRVVIAGTAHLAYRDPRYEALDKPALVPSYATGYANTRIHLYQCLLAAASNRLQGAVVEFGAFKGGTTAWLARVVQDLGLLSRVIAFDSWSGFPARRSILDMYTHPRCVFEDLAAVRAYLDPLGVEIIVGDISDTASARLLAEPVLLAFVDTDNYSPARAALQSVLPNLVVGGSIVFDHYTTTAEFIDTLGERMAGDDVLGRAGLFHLHGTGVFTRIAAARE